MNAEHYKKRAKPRLVVLTIIVCVVAVGIWYFATYSSLGEVTLVSNSVEQFAAAQAAKTFLAPPPLTAAPGTARRKGAPATEPLTQEGIIAQTNIQRGDNGG